MSPFEPNKNTAQGKEMKKGKFKQVEGRVKAKLPIILSIGWNNHHTNQASTLYT
jgi:hypothetical protein